MRPRALVFLLAAVVILITIAWLRMSTGRPATQPIASVPTEVMESALEVAQQPSLEQIIKTPPTPLGIPSNDTKLAQPIASPAEALATTNRLERLTQIRGQFQALAHGEASVALRAAKQITDPVERETALLALVTEWTKGELSSPVQRARAIGMFGLETGLGLELTKQPPLAMLWADELTEGAFRTALLRETAVQMLGTDPASAFAMSTQIPEQERSKFFESLYAGWAANDTDAALQSAQQLTDENERNTAMKAIQSVAPVGIGAALGIEDGYPVINNVLPGTPAEISGQLHKGDRIVALAQGNNSFVDVHSLPLNEVVNMIRGAPGTWLQLQVVASDAGPDSAPRMISVLREQLKFKK
ncbi:MAG TPA: PDZ domain-containing protein [Candidatus Dormibacteraeota bacterium]|nr:PDZ domain-containing protein [Candidatus Dormibacteraeota bacterium]